MPGIQVRNWHYKGQKPQPRKGKHDDKLVTVLRDSKGEGMLVDTIREMTKIPGATFDRIIARIRENDREDPLVHAVAESGFSYEVVQEGCRRKAYFIRNSEGQKPEPHFAH
jgi:hypothetical protein